MRDADGGESGRLDRWLGSLPLVVGTWLLWTRVAGWSLLTALAPFFLSLVLVVLGGALATSMVEARHAPDGGAPWGGGGGYQSSHRWVLNIAFWIAVIMAALSAPVWTHLGIHVLWTWKRSRAGVSTG